MGIYSSIISDSEQSLLADEAAILRNSRRRGVIKALSSSQESTLDLMVNSLLNRESREVQEKENIVEQVAEWETGKDIEFIDDSTLNGVASTIHQTHIPHLEEADIIEYNRGECLLEPTPEIEKYAQFIEDRPSKESSFPTTNGENDFDLTADEGFDILSNKRRQCVLHYLNNPPEEDVTLKDLSEFAALMEYGGIPSDSQRKTIYSTLLQCHLPKMDDLEIIEYHDIANVVEKGEYFEVVSNYVPDNLNQK